MVDFLGVVCELYVNYFRRRYLIVAFIVGRVVVRARRRRCLCVG